ncbi:MULTISPECIES: GNAT family N-acetyltransferase [Paenibacillus]|uniref:Ribosomal protein S18 acetylase RimI-like enzyme n=1 Tax=Paenibacillus pabuli TaxID=1472 RepID=A0A855XUC8_9BACL|nr:MULTISPECIES: GNAT family N-acetyltransferase [Paenibacillus]PWW39947.1 ribosomal protein S18 acetylase RimI-like enzyme [Paenibacillus pabuli]PXW06587.1 ribosomal protein S18 acetylase RimI-like enzyme [Paenibacillus taichungensis]RAJ00905.1 ribosomal protein S18 acetylase RimI-like enzyme [Paenibacillus pabuli]
MITIRFVSNEDIPHIQSIAYETWNYTYKGLYSESYIQNFLSRAYSDENLSRSVERDLQSAQRHYLIAEFNDKVVGYAQTRQVKEEEYELLRIYIRPEYHKMGIGKEFIQRYTQILKPINKLFAWVGKENHRGRAFYEKSGFKEIEEMIETIEGQSKTQVKYELDIS